MLSFSPGADQVVALGVAALLVMLFVLARVHYLTLPKLTARPKDAPLPDCMAVIPARNEEAVIARAVHSLPHDTVIVVDDHSEDRTAEVARKAGAGVMPAPPIPARGIGKANACKAGAAVLTSKWILFADADTWFEPGFLPAAVACAEANNLAFLSFYPGLECETLAETILAPYAEALYFCGLNGKLDPTAVFNGQCILVRRDAYEFIGSHGAVANTVTDDVKLAALARRHRLNLATVRAEALAHVRLREPWHSFRRGALRFMAVSSWMGIVIMIAGTVAALWLPVLVWLASEGHRTWAAVFAALPIVLIAPWYRRPLRALLAPVAIYGMIPILWGGMLNALGGGTREWKGRVV
ncbi:MAG: glycosyltransferase [Acidobacteriia bacterium]|nr:glycosyltransferase [Terriglobia bacterium]